MTTRCAVCRSPDLKAINRALSEPGAKAATVAAQFPDIHPKAVYRHMQNHLSADHQAVTAEKMVRAETAHEADLQTQVKSLLARMGALLTQAEKKGRTADAIRAAKEVRACIELAGKLMGQIQAGATVNVFTGPTWVAVQTRVVAALEPFPEARAAVVLALEGSPA